LPNRRSQPQARHALDLLKGAEPQTAEQLAARLGISAVAMRLQLNALAKRGLVRFEERKGRVGRPQRTWALTDAAQVRFPDAHATLAVDLLASVKALYGKKALHRLIVERERDMRVRYHRAVAGQKPLARKVADLAAARSDEGYMADARKTARGLLLVENHCPICAAAKECQQFCRSELRIFREVLPEANVERVDHVLAGARRCAYLVTAK
jgi:predicted ArsR family transcriptional regulator